MKLNDMGLTIKGIEWPRLVAWIVFLVAFFNVLIFVLRCANPVLMSDDWYFLDVFVRKVIDGNLHFADFFVRRVGGDHSEPVIKLILMWCSSWFHLDISFEAFIGVFIAMGCALLFRCLVLSEVQSKNTWPHQLAWATIAALIFSMNGTEIWGWALNSLQYSSFFLLPVFMWVVWRACQQEKYRLLIAITLVMAVVSDDNAIIGIAATLAALLLQVLLGRGAAWRVLFRIFGSVLTTLLVVRIGYLYAPIVGGAKDMSLAAKLHALLEQLESGQWPKWIEAPMTWAIASRSPLSHKMGGVSGSFDYVLLSVMLILQCWFWVKAVRFQWNLQIFVAVCLMLVTYGWIAGVLLYRVPVFGADYFKQDRYVRLFQFDPIALILMWSGSIRKGEPGTGGRRSLQLGIAACLALLAVQIPLSRSAWATAPYRQLYYRDLARQIYALAASPIDAAVLDNCNPQLPLCGAPLKKREDLLLLLRNSRLNIFSPAVLRTHPYLLGATDALDAADRRALLSSVEVDGAARKGWYESFRTPFLPRRDRALSSGIDVDAWPAKYVPLMLSGCWGPDGGRHHASSWCGPAVDLVLQRPSTSSSLTIMGWFPWELYKKAGRTTPVTIMVTVDDVPVSKTAIGTDGMFMISVPAHNLPESAEAKDLIPVKILTDGSFQPSKFLQSADTRILSMKLTSVEFSGETIR